DGSGEEKDIHKDNIIVNSVIDMAKKLDMTTVAEGVEEESQAKQLREMGCDIAQGYFYAKPMSAEDFERLLKNSL
ncbi:MAG: EAL domain-containing protein, partial [Treponema sp.]|nr:EAL domain-containing protein [Treponema sp.]